MNPVFIFGSDPGSNAFLSALLASHPRCVATPQFTYAYIRAARRSQFDFGDKAADIALHQLSRLGEPLTPVPPTSTCPSFVAQLVTAYAADHGRPEADVWLEHVCHDHLPLLADTFPEARFLHLVRDGRAFAAAHGHAARKPQALSQSSRTWRRATLKGLEAEALLGTKRFYRLTYEALLDDLAAGLEALAHVVGVSPQRFVVPTSVLHKDYAPHLYAWRRQLSTHEIRRFEEVSGSLLTRLGYGLEASGSVPARPDTWSRAGRQHLRQAREANSGHPARPTMPTK